MKDRQQRGPGAKTAVQTAGASVGGWDAKPPTTSAGGFHEFCWRDAMDVVVRWRQLSEPNDQVSTDQVSCRGVQQPRCPPSEPSDQVSRVHWNAPLVEMAYHCTPQLYCSHRFWCCTSAPSSSCSDFGWRSALRPHTQKLVAATSVRLGGHSALLPAGVLWAPCGSNMPEAAG